MYVYVGFIFTFILMCLYYGHKSGHFHNGSYGCHMYVWEGPILCVEALKGNQARAHAVSASPLSVRWKSEKHASLSSTNHTSFLRHADRSKYQGRL